MRPWILVAFVLHVYSCVAQPGWRGMDVVFSFYDQGIHRSPHELLQDPTFQLIMDGETRTVGSYNGSWFSVAGFSGHNSDPMNHVDTLWMQLGYRGQLMRIGFPPRHRFGGTYYAPTGLGIDHLAGIFLVTELPKEFQIRGEIGNRADFAALTPTPLFQVLGNDLLCDGLVLDQSTGQFNGRAMCSTTIEGRYEWVNFILNIRNGQQEVLGEMHVRTHYSTELDLGAFDLLQGYYFFNGREFALDTAVPRDTVVATDRYGPQLHIGPINPIVSDTLRLTAEYPSSGEPMVMHYHMKKQKGVTRISFSFAARTNVILLADSWTERGPVLELIGLKQGRYTLTQESSKEHSVRDVDLLLGREVDFEVVEQRTELN